MFLCASIAIILGSFLNVCIYRIPKEESIAYPPSHCMSCGERLRSRDLIPVVSYILSRGRCRYCGETISSQYPIVEILNGLLYLIIYNRLGLTPYSITLMLLSSVLIVIAFIDIGHQIIPDRLNIAIIVLGIIQMFLVENPSLVSRIIGLVIGGGLFLLIAIVTNGNMGGGDVKLMGALGFVFGWKIILLITLLSFITGAIISLGLLGANRVSRKDFIAFGPFIALACYISMIYGQDLIQVYIRLLI